MAISTPAQKPRGAARSTLSTATRPRYRCWVRAGPGPILGRWLPPESCTWCRVRPRTRPGSWWATRSLAVDGQVPRDILDWRFLVDEPDLVLDVRAGRPRADRRGAEGGRRAARRRGPLGAVRPGPHLRQPLRVLLHLPAAAGAAFEPLPEGRRLPAELPLRELHHPHPLHRGGPRAGGHAGAQPAERLASTPPTPRCAPRCCATGGAAPACAGSAPSSTTASRCTARSSCAPA